MLDLLQGIRIISFNHFLLGPMGIQALADVGADVIAVETPEGAWQRHWSSGDIWRDGQGMVHMCTNRNKRSVALDLKSSKGKEIALKLIDGADVVAENFRPGVMDKLGFGYDALRRRKPSLVYASASGYGPDGPYAEKPGQDLLAQALFGMMVITGPQTGRASPGGRVDHRPPWGGAVRDRHRRRAAAPRAHRQGLPCRRDAHARRARPAGGIADRVAQRAANAGKRHHAPACRRLVLPGPYGVYATQQRSPGRSLRAAEDARRGARRAEARVVHGHRSWTRRTRSASWWRRAASESYRGLGRAPREAQSLARAGVQDYAASCGSGGAGTAGAW